MARLIASANGLFFVAFLLPNGAAMIDSTISFLIERKNIVPQILWNFVTNGRFCLFLCPAVALD
jgi:hypothetical protein